MRIALLTAALVFTSGCGWLVDMVAFHPDNKHNISSAKLPRGVREVWFRTSDKVKLHGLYLANPDSKAVLIYFHGNAGNISMRLSILRALHRMGISVLGVSYRGYGKSKGSPSEAGLYRDGAAALRFVARLGFPLRRTIIMGRSIGSTVATHTARHRDLMGLILVSPLLTGRAQARAGGFGWFSFVAGSSFDNRGKAKQVRCPVLVVHGTKDKVIPHSHGVKLYSRFTTPKRFVTIKGGGHNNLSYGHFGRQYMGAVETFLKKQMRR